MQYHNFLFDVTSIAMHIKIFVYQPVNTCRSRLDKLIAFFQNVIDNRLHSKVHVHNYSCIFFTEGFEQ